MKHPAPTTQEGVATWTVATCHPIPVAILDDLRQHLDCGIQVRVLLRLPGPVFTIDAALLARRQRRIRADIMERLDELNVVADGRPPPPAAPLATGSSGRFTKEANVTELTTRRGLVRWRTNADLTVAPGHPCISVLVGRPSSGRLIRAG